MTRAREIANVLGRNIESTTFTATAGQTAFSITHAAGRIQVYMNGLLLDPTVDWTSDGSTVTLTEGAVAGDELEVVKFDNLAVADAIPRTGHTGTIDFSSATFTPPAGHVIDVKHVSLTASQTFNSTSYADVNNASITVTPTSSSSKFLVVCVCQYYLKDNYSGWQAFKLRLVRGSTELINDASYGVGIYNNPNTFYLMGKTSQAYLDSPATTNSITYKAQGSVNNTNHPSVSVNEYGHGYMFVQEITG